MSVDVDAPGSLRPTTATRALVVGPEFHGYNESIAAALQQVGLQTRVVETPRHNPSGIRNRILVDLAATAGVRSFADAWGRRFNAQLLEEYRQWRPDFVLVIKGRWIAPETLQAMRESRRALWFQDAAFRCSSQFVELARVADQVFVFEGTDVEMFRDAHGIGAHFLPMGFDPRVYFPIADVEQDIDLSFVGFPYPNRVAILNQLVADFPHARIRVFGRYLRYRKARTWLTFARRTLHPRLRAVYTNREITPDEVNRIYARSKLVLNIHHEQSRHGCNPRVFEIIGADACQLVDDNEYLRRQLGKNVVTYGNYGELRGHVERLLGDPAERLLTRRRTRSIRGAHTFEARVRELLDRCGVRVLSQTGQTAIVSG